MILRSATNATVQHLMPVFDSDPETGSYRVRPTALVDVARIPLTWANVDGATRKVVQDHYNRFGAKGVPFLYEDMPAAVLPEGYYAYDEPLSIQVDTARRITMRTAVRQTLTYD